MKKTMSIIIAALLVLSMPAFAGGAGEAASGEVYFLNFKPEIAEVYTNEVAPAFEEATGIPLKVVTAASNQYEATLRSEISKSEPPTIFQINGPVGLQNWKDYAAPLDDTAFYGMLSDPSMALSDGGQVLAVPYTVEGYGIIYNDAIMRAYCALPDKAVDIASAEEITDFETLKAVVEDMTAHKEELGIQGVFASTSFAPGSEWRWTTHLVNPALQAEFGDRATTFAAKEFAFTANENFKALFDLYLDNSVTAKGQEFYEHPYELRLTGERDFVEGEDDDDENAAAANRGGGGGDTMLLSMLKDLRRSVARRLGLQPWVIFSDASLEDMSILYPVTYDELKNCQGVGDGKARKFGKEFIELIGKYVQENEIDRPDDFVVKSTVNKSANKVFIIQSIDRKLSLDDIADAAGLEMDELIDEIEAIVYSGTRLDIGYYINENIDDDTVADIYGYFREDAESDSLQEAMEELES